MQNVVIKPEKQSDEFERISRMINVRFIDDRAAFGNGDDRAFISAAPQFITNPQIISVAE